jgi:hypothetical protein
MSIIIHGAMVSWMGKNEKPTVEFLGMIFFGGVGSMLVLATQLLATQEISKKRKNTK